MMQEYKKGRMSMTVHTKSTLLVLTAVTAAGLPAFGLPASPSDDAYLRAVQAEGEKLTPLDRARAEIRADENREKSAAGNGRVRTPVDLGAFERLLNADAPASFSLYSRLKGDQKLSVYEVYRKNGKLSEAKRAIVDTVLGL
jgi:hypothetical protein